MNKSLILLGINIISGIMGMSMASIIFDIFATPDYVLKNFSAEGEGILENLGLLVGFLFGFGISAMVYQFIFLRKFQNL